MTSAYKISDMPNTTLTFNGQPLNATIDEIVETDNKTVTGNGTSALPIGLANDLVYIGNVTASKTANANATVSFGVVNASVPSGYSFVGWLGGQIYSGPNNPPKAAGYINCHDNVYWNTTSANIWAYFNNAGTYNVRAYYLCVRS